MSRGPGWPILLAASLLLVPILTVQAQEGATLPGGVLHVSGDNFTIDAGQAVTIGPGTKVYGVGQLHVWGTLTVKGASNDTANFTVPIVVFPGGRVDMEHAHVWTIGTTAVEARGAEVELRHVLFEGNNRALLATGASRVRVSNSTFREHAGEAVYVEEAANVGIETSLFTGNGRGVTVYSAASFHLNGSEFAANGQHLVVDLGPWSTQGEITLARTRFLAPAATPAELPAILLRHDPPLVDEAAQRTVRLAANRIEGAPVGLRAEGRGLTVLSVNDTFVDNGIGLSVQLATVHVDAGTFGNDRDVEGSGRVTLDEPTYLRQRDAPAPLDATPTRWLPWAIGGALALVVAAALLVPRLRQPREIAVRGPPTRAAEVTSHDAAPPPPRPATPDLAHVTSVERRILEDIVAHPGTPQRAVADRLGTTRQALHYHVKKLEARGLIVKAIEGRETRCTVPPAVAKRVAATAATRTGSDEKG